MSAPVDNLVRLNFAPVELRAADDQADGDGNTMHGHFAVFDRWTEIDSWFEGRFLERISKGAFRDAVKAWKEGRSNVRVLFDHGADPMIGNKPLGEITSLREDDHGAAYTVRLFDEASYVADLKPALRAGQLGASFRFRVTAERWLEPKTEAEHNPNKLPERTITGVELFEFGPVAFPAYAEASAGLRSGTDSFVERLLANPQFVARLTERASPRVVQHILDDATTHGHVDEQPTTPAEAAHGHDAVRLLASARAALIKTKETR